jgi:hypothetical protein
MKYTSLLVKAYNNNAEEFVASYKLGAHLRDEPTVTVKEINIDDTWVAVSFSDGRFEMYPIATVQYLGGTVK